MTLAKRLVLTMTSLLILVFLGVLTISINNTRNYLNQQLKVTAQDTATSLGKSVSDAIVKRDNEKLKSVIDAIYDRGYYRSIRVRDKSGAVLVNREQKKLFIKEVPDWFISFIQLRTPAGRQDVITPSFKRAGVVTVVAHPGLAYVKLWQSFVDNLQWLGFMASLSFVGIWFLVRYLLTPITNLEIQANEIARGNFVVQEKLPSTPELYRVADTMNRMSSKVAQMLETQTELTETMRTRAYQDSLTGLRNRRYFAEQLDHLLNTPEEFISGSLILVEIGDFKEYNQEHGYIKADELLKKIANIINSICHTIDRVCIARVSGASFAVLAPNIGFKHTRALADRIQAEFESLHHKGKIDDVATTHAGISFYDGNQDGTDLLSMADLALRAAQIKGPNHWKIYDDQSQNEHGIRTATAWKRAIQDTINNKSIALHFQPVRSLHDDSILHYEVLARLPDREGKLMNASQFLPMAQRYNLATAIDLVVIEKLVTTMSDENRLQYAVNLSSSSIQDEKFTEWLLALMKQFPRRARSIIFEMREYSVVNHIDIVRDTVKQLRELGCSFSIDHFGIGSPDFGYLMNTRIDYIKIDGSYIHNIEKNEDHRFFMKSIAEIAHGLDIKVIGEYVETESELKTIRALNLDGAQGHYIGKPYHDVAPDELINISA